MQENFNTNWIETLGSILKIAIPSILIGAAKMVVMVSDKKTTLVNAIISYSVGVVLATTVCYYLKDIISSVWLFALNSVITLAGVNIMRAIMYKKDWNTHIDSITNHLVAWVKSKFKIK